MKRSVDANGEYGQEVARPATPRRLILAGFTERLIATADTGKAILVPDRSRLTGNYSFLRYKGFLLRSVRTPEGIAAWCERIEPRNGKSAR